MINSVLLIGLGQIGVGYDIDNLDSDLILTHANASRKHKNFNLVAGIDASSAKRQKFSNVYDIDSFKNINAEVIQKDPSIVIIATPTETHSKVMNQVLDLLNPKLILCEKPLDYSEDEAEQMVQRCKDKNVALFVNYMRQSDISTLEISKMIEEEVIERPIKANVWYSKGLFNNGSHLTNLLERWLGNLTKTFLINSGERIGERDYEPDFFAEYEGGSANFISSKEENFSIYTIELITRSGRLFYSNGGELISWQPVKADNNYPGYKILSNNYKEIYNELFISQFNVLNQINNFLNGKSYELCTGEQALVTIRNIIKITGAINDGK